MVVLLEGITAALCVAALIRQTAPAAGEAGLVQHY